MAMDPDRTVAIVGMAAMLPGAATLDAYWRNLVDGVDAITDLPADRWDALFYDPGQAHRPDRVYCRRGGFLGESATFEPLRFGIMPASVPDIEPDQLIALQVAAAAIDDAGGGDRLPDRDRVGVILGRGGILSPAQARWAQRIRVPSQLIELLRELLPDVAPARLELVRDRLDEALGPQQPEGAIGIVSNLTASRIANRLDLHGASYTVDAACASSLLAVDQAVTELVSGRLDAVLTGGVHHSHDISFWAVFSQLKALSRRGEIRPFDRAADGLLVGEGTGVVVLKRLADALRDGDRVHAVIRGVGVASDGRSASLFNPAVSGQVLAMRRAWRSAGLDPTAPDALGLLEAHGTATPTGDAAELTSVAEVFGPYRGGVRPVIGSVKSMIGHTMPAAGIAGLIKATLAVSRGILLPTLHCDEPRPELERTRFRTIGTSSPWESDRPRRAGVNAFGFGGINAHVIVEQLAEPVGALPAAVSTVSTGSTSGSTPSTVSTVHEPDRVLWLAAADRAALARSLERDDADLRRAGTARAGDGRVRLGLVDPSDDRLGLARQAVARGRAWRGGRDLWFSPEPLLSDGSGRLAFVFPGIEAEFRPRVDDVAAHFGLATRDWSNADLGRHGTGVIELGRLLDAALRRMDVVPDTVAGHSLGEWSAAITVGQLHAATADDFLGLFDTRAIEMPDRRFAAIGAGVDRVVPMLDGYPEVLLSHDNAPGQCIVNGPADQVRALVGTLRGNNILCQELPFRSAFHTPVFAGGLAAIGRAIGRTEVRAPACPVWSATIAAPFPTDPEQVGALIVRHMVEPVRFRPTIEAMYGSGVRVFLTVGTGQLASVIDDNLRGRDHLAMPVNVPHRTGLDQLRRVATALWVEGGRPNLAALDAPVRAPARPVSPPVTPGKATGAAVRLDLGGPLIRLGAGAGDLLGVGPLDRPPAAVPRPAALRPGGAPRSAAPHSAAPHSAAPHSVAPQSVAPHSVAPHSAAPHSAAPQSAAPQSAAPHSVAPQSVAPHSVAPQSAAPRSVAPQSAAPQSAANLAAAPSAAGPATPPGGTAALAALDRLATGSRAAAELAALLRDTAHSAVDVLDAAASRPPSRPAPPSQRAARSRPAPAARPVPPASGAVSYRETLRVSLDAMPYLLDHCFFAQPEDWPYPEDRWPVVPATTVVQHMMESVERAVPGTRAVAVRDAKLNRWVLAAPPQDVEITVHGDGPYAVAFGAFATATVDVASAYPTDAPDVFRPDPAIERPAKYSAEDMYAKRLLFHGPRFQGLTEICAVADWHVRGRIVTPAAPGALLDNALQLFGNWLYTTQPVRTSALPLALGHVRFFGPPPAPGTAIDCAVRVREVTESRIQLDAQLVQGHRVWCAMDGIVERRFDSSPTARLAERSPERHAFSVRQPEGWAVAFDCWNDLVTQGMAAHAVLGSRAYPEYERQPGAARKRWLLGRIAVKDAVRFQLWDRGDVAIYPVELTVSDGPGGQPRVRLRAGRNLPEYAVSLASCGEVAVAIARPAPARVGIDVVEVAAAPDVELSAAEADVIGDADRAVGVARLRAAKAAAAKADGAGDPGAAAVRAVTPDRVTVAIGDRTYALAHRPLHNPEYLPDRRYVVAWTEAQ